MIERPKTPLSEFEEALKKADLTTKEIELLEYIMYTSVFTQPSLAKDLKISSKPPILSSLCNLCRKIGIFMPDHYQKVILWSKEINENKIMWEGHLVCAEAFNIDGLTLSPFSKTSLFDVLVVHKELFIGFD